MSTRWTSHLKCFWTFEAVSQLDDQERRTPTWMRLVHLVACKFCFQPLHPVRSSCASLIVLQPWLQTFALVALLLYLFLFFFSWCHCGVGHVTLVVLFTLLTALITSFFFLKKGPRLTPKEKSIIFKTDNFVPLVVPGSSVNSESSSSSTPASPESLGPEASLASGNTVAASSSSDSALGRSDETSHKETWAGILGKCQEGQKGSVSGYAFCG